MSGIGLLHIHNILIWGYPEKNFEPSILSTGFQFQIKKVDLCFDFFVAKMFIKKKVYKVYFDLEKNDVSLGSQFPIVRA